MTVVLAELGPSLLHTLAWWSVLVVLTVLGWLAVRPATADWHDHGWAIARPLALLALAFIVFTSAHALPVFNPLAMWLLLAITAVALMLRARRVGFALRHLPWRSLAAAELRFVLPFLLYLLMRGFNHDIIGLEKFMDLAFVNAALRVDTMPVPDPWFAGAPINYYYFGHYVTALLCKLSGTPSAYGFNLMLATIFASVFQLAYAFVAEMGRAVSPALRNGMGLLAGTWLCLGGSVHGFLYGFVRPWLADLGLISAPANAFLMSDSTRFVGFNPGTGDKLITEFPAYALYVGDLHAHLINLPWVLLFCCVVLGWLRAGVGHLARRWLAAAAWLAGVFVMSNSWDAMMYAGVLAALLVIRGLAALRRGGAAVRAAVIDCLVAAAICAVTVAPFLLQFDAHSDGFLPTHSRTPWYQWLVLYGLHAALALIGCGVAIWRRNAPLAAPERLLLVTMTVAALVFTWIPEHYYLKDIYGGEYYRANTAFKFGFQAFTLLTLAACVGVGLLLATRGRGVSRMATIVLFEIALLPPLYYGWFVVQGGLGVWRQREWTLNGQRYLANTYPDDFALMRFLAQQPQRPGRIIEGIDLSYTYGARIATNTGIPTVLGWPTHEQLWRGSDPAVRARRDAIDAFYITRSRAAAQAVIDRYHPRWIVVGGMERQRYGPVNSELIQSLGPVVFRSGESFIVDVGG